jgi:hypothetical protein
MAQPPEIVLVLVVIDRWFSANEPLGVIEARYLGRGASLDGIEPTIENDNDDENDWRVGTNLVGAGSTKLRLSRGTPPRSISGRLPRFSLSNQPPSSFFLLFIKNIIIIIDLMVNMVIIGTCKPSSPISSLSWPNNTPSCTKRKAPERPEWGCLWRCAFPEAVSPPPTNRSRSRFAGWRQPRPLDIQPPEATAQCGSPSSGLFLKRRMISRPSRSG